jgi:flagellar protein FlaG
MEEPGVKQGGNMMKAAGNIVDFNPTIEIKHSETSPNGVRHVTDAEPSELSAKKSGNIEKTAEQVQDYLKTLVEDKDSLEEVLKFINSDLENKNTKVEFSYNDKISQMMVQVKDKFTGEVIRSLPPEHLVKLMEKFREDGTLEGVILSKHA